MHGVSNQDTHLYLPHNNSLVHLTTIEVQRSGWITNGMQSGWTTLRLRTFIPDIGTFPQDWNGPAKNSVGPP